MSNTKLYFIYMSYKREHLRFVKHWFKRRLLLESVAHLCRNESFSSFREFAISILKIIEIIYIDHLLNLLSNLDKFVSVLHNGAG